MKKYLSTVLSIYIAFVFVQSLFFKFSAAPESIHIFQTLEDWSGLSFFEPIMRLVLGGSELVASILLFIPGVQVLGALIAFGIINGAIFFHLFTPLGVEVHGDGGLLFAMAVGVWIAFVALIYIRKEQILSLLKK